LQLADCLLLPHPGDDPHLEEPRTHWRGLVRHLPRCGPSHWRLPPVAISTAHSPVPTLCRRVVYKTLNLLEYLLRHGSERVIEDARDHLRDLKKLQKFEFVDPEGKDCGVNVREKARIIVEQRAAHLRARQSAH
jgi:hypothetical protein